MANRLSWARAAAVACLVVLCATSGAAQSKAIDYDTLYRFLGSVGFEYQYLPVPASYELEINTYYDLSLFGRLPIPRLPQLQPWARVGLTQLIPIDAQAEWRRIDWYLLGGAAWMSRLSKNLEIGADLGLGFSEGIFTQMDASGPRGQPTLVAVAGAHLGLDPSYSMSIDVHPTLRYAKSLTPLTKFDALTFGIGVSASYRFGEDPDAPQAVVRDLKIGEVKADTVFAAMQAVYEKRPFASAAITNSGRYPLSDIRISFMQPGYMDSPTLLAFPGELAPGESAPLEIKAVFSGQVFATQGAVTLTGQLTAEYASRGKTAIQSFSVPYELQDKNKIVWDDDRKVGAFITPDDSALKNYTSFVVRTAKDETIKELSANLQKAMQLFCALREFGIVYKCDPTTSFTEMQAHPELLDRVNLPRETLDGGTGDCDDLTALYCAALETLGVPSGFVTVPGHIFPMLDTGIAVRDFAQVHPDATMTIALGKTLWVPVEITTVKDGDFLAAWRLAIDQFRALDATPAERGVYQTAECQGAYPAVVVMEKDLGLQYGSATAIVENVRATRERIIDLIVGAYDAAAAKTGNKRDLNRLGLTCAKFGRYPAAQKALLAALAIDRNYPEPLVNLANVYYLKGEYQNALRSYIQAADLLAELGRGSSPTAGGVLVNIAQSYYELENFDQASAYFDKAVAIDPSLKQAYAHLAAAGSGRAASVSTIAPPLYADEE